MRSLEQSANTEQRSVAREDPTVQARESSQRAVAREDPEVRAHGQKRLTRWHASSKMASIYFISLVAYGINPVFMVVGTFIFPVQHLGLGRNVAIMATFLLSVTTLMRN